MTSMRQRRRRAAFAVKRRPTSKEEDWSNPTDWQRVIMEIALIRGPVRKAKLQMVLRIGYSRAVSLFKALLANGIVNAEAPHMGMVKRIVSEKHVEYWVCKPRDRARFVQAIDDECYTLARSVSKRLGKVPRSVRTSTGRANTG